VNRIVANLIIDIGLPGVIGAAWLITGGIDRCIAYLNSRKSGHGT